MGSSKPDSNPFSYVINLKIFLNLVGGSFPYAVAAGE